MADFINFEADDEDMYNECERFEKESENEDEHDREFIHDRQYDESVTDYYAFENVTRPYEESMEDAVENFDYTLEPENYCEEPICAVFDNFDSFISKFNFDTSTLISLLRVFAIHRGWIIQIHFFIAYYTH